MGRLKLAAFAALLTSSAAAQQCGTITTCPPVSTPLAGTELLYVVQAGVSKKMTVTQLAAGIGPLSIGTTTISPSTNGGVLFDNAGVLGDSTTLPSGLTAPSLTVTGAFSAAGLVTNADLVNASTTVNGQVCALGASCSISAAAALVPGTTTISPSTNGGVLSDNAGILADSKTLPTGLTIPSATLTAPSLGVATATSINGVTIGASGGALSIASGKTLTDTSGVGADLLLGATGGGFTAYGGASSAGNVLTALSAAGAGSFQAYGLTGNSTLVETTSGGLITASLLPAATTSTLGAVSTDGATIANSSGAISCRTATSSLLGCASFGAGLSVTAGAVTPAFGTATNQVAEGGVITAAGPIGSATAVPVITYNAAGQLTTVTTAAISIPVANINNLGTGVGSALVDALNGAGGLVGYGGAFGNATGHASLDLAVSALGTNVQTALGDALNAQNGVPSVFSASLTTGHCLEWGPGIEDAGAACGSGGSTLTANSTLTSGFTANQFLYSDGSKLQAGTFGAGLTPSGGTTALGDTGLGYATGVMDLLTSLGLGSITSPIVVLSAPGAGEFELSVGGTDELDFGVTESGVLLAPNGIYVGVDKFNGAIGVTAYNSGDYPSGLLFGNTSTTQAGVFNATAGLSGSPGGIGLGSGYALAWSSSGRPQDNQDTGLLREAAGIVEVANTTANNAGYLNYAAWMAGIVYSVAGTAVPSASTLGKGARIFVSDATACVLGTTYTGSGSTACPLYSDGTNWKEGA